MAPLNRKHRPPTGNRVLVSAMVWALVVLGGAETAERAWAEPLVVHGADQTAEPDAIESRRVHMLAFGDRQTGAYYPTGQERADSRGGLR